MSEPSPHRVDIATPPAAGDIDRPDGTTGPGRSPGRKDPDRPDGGAPVSDPLAVTLEVDRRVSATLSGLSPEWTVLNDRLLHPGVSEASLDHIVIGPGGVFYLDAKTRAGRVSAWEGGLFQHVVRDGERHTLSLAGELQRVHDTAAYMSGHTGVRVIPVLCLASVDEAAFPDPALLRGVWVVPMCKLVDWLGARPRVFERDSAARVATHSMATFPPVGTDPDLLAAMAAAGAGAPHSGRPPGAARSGGRRRRWPRALGWLGATMAVAGLGTVLVVSGLGSSMTSGVQRMATSAEDVARQGPAAATAKPTSATAPAVPCSSIPAEQISAVIRRKVMPVSTAGACAWGTRLDDPSTVLVTVRTSPGHVPYETELQTSVQQQRVVYGMGFNPWYTAGTGLWVATDQPIGQGRSRVLAVADTNVVVCGDQLKVSDNKARAMALAIAKVVNRPHR